MSRSVKEWIGKTPDTKVPDRVKLRVFKAWEGVCHKSGYKIQVGDTWDLDHIQPLILGGENRESNLAPILREHHKVKTAGEMAIKAKTDRLQKKHLGIDSGKPKWPSQRQKQKIRELEERILELETELENCKCRK